LVTDYAASSLRKAALQNDGTLNPAAYTKWAKQHADALRALPENIRSQFSDAASAAQAASDTTALKAAAIKDAQTGAIGQIMKAQTPEDVTRTIGSMFGAKDSVTQLRALTNAASKSPTAMQGLRQAVADHIANKFISNTEAGTSEVNLLRSDQFQNFIRQNKAALSTVFSPAEVDNLSAIAQDLRRSNRSITAVKLPGGSNTAQDVLGAASRNKQPSSILKAAIDAMGAAAGHAVAGMPGAFVGALGTNAIQAMRETGISNVNDLVTKALLNPDVARALLAKMPKRPNMGAAIALTRALRSSGLRAAAVLGSQPQKTSP
jgi:hypothetical protein